MRYKRNDDALRELLETYQIEGTEVMVPIFGEATILRAIPSGPVRRYEGESAKLSSPWMSYLVKAKKPVSFNDWMHLKFKGRQRVDVQMNLDEWMAAATGARKGIRDEEGRDQSILPMSDYLRQRLEDGGTLSWSDVEHDDLQGRSCLDSNNNVTCYTFWSKDVVIFPNQLKAGSMVEHHWKEKISDGETLEFSVQGVVIRVDQDERGGPRRNGALLELFVPTPYLLCPNAIDNSRLQKSFYVEGTYALAYGTYEAFEIAQEESGQKLIPPGKWDDHQRLYTLKEFLPLSVIEDLCQEAYKDEPHCVLQSLILYVVPMHLELEDPAYQGTWRPLAKNEVPPEAVISYDFDEE